MIDARSWMAELIEKLQNTFGKRVMFVGLQGSYGREEATEKSDIDPVVILDCVDAETLKIYAGVLDTMPHRKLACGFIGGWDEINCWDGADLLQLYYDTMPLFGSLDILKDRMNQSAIRHAVHTGACGIYHVLAHNFLHGRKASTVQGQLKTAGFMLQNMHLEKTGMYVRKQRDLIGELDGIDRRIMEKCLAVRNGKALTEEDMEDWSMELFMWVKELICQYGK